VFPHQPAVITRRSNPPMNNQHTTAPDAEGESPASMTEQFLTFHRANPHVYTTLRDLELNNNHKAFYARALMHFEKDLVGIFDLRRAPEADAWIASVRGDGEAVA
jgi:hypothetical protein